ncbi:MAG: GntR family transcriptional regulator, partial [Firmicutes bacterium]|nr:GntR family transcriptional regulator [Bacillota bacterium]
VNRRLLLTSLRERLYESLKEDILTNKFKPGEELQIEKLAEEFGVSSTPVREALVRLEGAGLVVLMPNRGAQVAPISLEDVKNVWEVRRLLEPHAAKVAAKQCEMAEINALYEKMLKIVNGPVDFATYINSDLEIHELMFKHLSNTLLREILDRVDQHLMRIRYLAESNANGFKREVVEQVTKEHLSILDALKKRDTQKAAAATLEHLINGETRTLKTLQQVTDLQNS